MVDVVDEALDNSHLSEATFNRLHARFPCRQIIELLLTIGCYRMMSRLVTLLELELETVFGARCGAPAGTRECRGRIGL